MFKKVNVSDPETHRTFAVIDDSKALGSGDLGPIRSLHDGEETARRAAKKTGGRMFELRTYRSWKQGDHITHPDTITERDRKLDNQRRAEQESRIIDFARRTWAGR